MTDIHLTRLRLPYEIVVKRALRDRYAWHQRLWDLFPGRPDAQRDFLFRLDERNEFMEVLVLGSTAADRPGWCPDHDFAFATKLIPASFYGHQAYRFRLLANPTRKVPFSASGERLPNSRRVALTDGAAQREWLARKAAAAGFSFHDPSLEILPLGRERFLREGRTGVHHAVEFTGRLQVTDATTFQQSSLAGIGPAKAFGFGLLAIAPVSESKPIS